MQRDIEFRTEDGVVLRGWHLPAGTRGTLGAGVATKATPDAARGHFDAYVQDFAASSGAACEWFREHLLVIG
jgi:hypothetical protein